MKRKLSVFFVIAIAVLGTIVIYKHFDKQQVDNKSVTKFSDEYTLVDKNNVFVYSNIDEVANMLENGTGIVFMAFPECPWCQYYAKYLNEVARENNIKEIYYLNIKHDRQISSNKYSKITKLLGNYLYSDDSGDSKVFAPNLTFAKNGKIIANDNETAITEGKVKVEDYWNQEKINEFKEKIASYIKDYDTTCSTCN